MSDKTQQLCTFYVDDLLLGIDVQQVQEVIRYQNIARVPMAPPVIRGLINLRGQIITALELRTQLGMPARNSEELPTNVIVRDGENTLSLLVDSIGDVIEVERDCFEPPPSTVAAHTRGLLLGAYKLPERLLLALNLHRAVEVPADAYHHTPA